MMKNESRRIRRITRDALLCAVSLIVFVIELQLPPLTAIPGIKPGLANIVTVYAMYKVGKLDALAILLARIFIGTLFCAQPSVILYSLAGGILSYLVLLALHRLIPQNRLWICSAFAAVAHNLGQILMACLILSTTAVFYYFPFLIVSGIVSGTFTGVCAQLCIKHKAI